MSLDDFRARETKRVQIFIQKQIYSAPAELGPCMRLVLRHLRADGSTTHDIETVVVPAYHDASDAPTAEDVERMASDLVNAALEDADGLNRGVQRYGVLSFHDRHAGESTSRCSLRVSGGRSTWSSDEAAEAGLGELADSEGPNATGIAAQSMRHTEAMLKMISAAWHHTMGTFADQNQSMQRHMATMMERHFQLVAVLEASMSQKHQRDLDSKKSEMWVKATDELLDKIKVLLPHAVNKMSGRKLLPTRSSPGEQELVAVVETLRPEQLEQFRTILAPEQFLALLSVIERVVKDAGPGSLSVLDGGKKPDGEGGTGGAPAAGGT